MSTFGYPKPFEEGECYLALETFGDEANTFVEGEQYLFTCDAYDFHAGVVRYWFRNVLMESTEILNLWIDQSRPNYHDLGKLRKV